MIRDPTEEEALFHGASPPLHSNHGRRRHPRLTPRSIEQFGSRMVDHGRRCIRDSEVLRGRAFADHGGSTVLGECSEVVGDGIEDEREASGSQPGLDFGGPLSHEGGTERAMHGVSVLLPLLALGVGDLLDRARVGELLPGLALGRDGEETARVSPSLPSMKSSRRRRSLVRSIMTMCSAAAHFCIGPKMSAELSG